MNSNSIEHVQWYFDLQVSELMSFWRFEVLKTCFRYPIAVSIVHLEHQCCDCIFAYSYSEKKNKKLMEKPKKSCNWASDSAV